MKPADMKKSILIIIALAVVFTISGLLAAGSPERSTENNSCKETMKECCYKKVEKPSSGGMIWETLSREFLSLSPIIR